MKVSFVHGILRSTMNKIFLSKAYDIVNDCKALGLTFMQSDSKVIDVVCDMLEG